MSKTKEMYHDEIVKGQGQLSAFPNEVDKIKAFFLDYPSFMADSIKAYKGNKAAIRRCRNVILELEKTCRTARKELTNVRVNLHLTK
jgi:hypothetical protein